MDLEGTDKDTGQSGSLTVINDAWMANVPGYEQVKGVPPENGAEDGARVSARVVPDGDVRSPHDAGHGGIRQGDVEGIGRPGRDRNEDGKRDHGGHHRLQFSEGAERTRRDHPGLPFGRKKKDPEPEQNDQKQSGPALLLQMTTDMSDFSTSAVDTSKFDVPAGFKQVNSDLVGRKR